MAGTEFPGGGDGETESIPNAACTVTTRMIRHEGGRRFDLKVAVSVAVEGSITVLQVVACPQLDHNCDY